MTRVERTIGLLALAAATVAAGAVAVTPAQAPVPTARSLHGRTGGGAPAALASAVAATPAPRPLPAAPRALPAPARPEPPQAGCPVPPYHGPAYHPRPLQPPAVSEAALPPVLAVRGKAASLAAITGKGLWVTTFSAAGTDVSTVLAEARRGGVRNLWVRTGGSIQGYYGDGFLPSLVPAAHALGLRVVAWDFPFLSDPVADAARASRALAAGVDGFAPDVETGAEGTHTTVRRIAVYLSRVRAAAGDRPVIATVPRATPYNLRTYPYRAFAGYADAFAPMVYWSCNEPGQLVHESMRALGAILPVAPIGQGYDMASDGGRHGLPTLAETWRFLDAAKRSGAVGASMWTAEAMGDGQYQALAAYPW